MLLEDEGVQLLSRAECRRLLAEASVGRVAITSGALPAVLPVNFVLLDGDVIFMTSEGSKLDAAVQDAVVAFEVDDVDELSETGWSVNVVGRASVISEPDDLARVSELDLRPWAGDRHHYVRIDASIVTGRRLLPEDERS